MTKLRHWDDLAAELAGGGVVRRRLDGAAADLVRVDIKAGTRADRHAHAYEQFVQVVSRAGILQTEGGGRPFSASCLFHFPADAWHAADFKEDTVLIETNLRALPG